MREHLQPQAENHNNPLDRVQILREVRLFSPLAQKDLEEISGHLEERHYSGGNVVYGYGDEGDAMYIVRTGRVAASLSPEAPERVDAIFGEGDYFGEMSLLSDRPRLATLTVTSPEAGLLILSKESFERILAGNLTLMRHFVNLMSTRLAETSRLADTVEAQPQRTEAGLLLDAITEAGFEAKPESEDGKIKAYHLVKRGSEPKS